MALTKFQSDFLTGLSDLTTSIGTRVADKIFENYNDIMSELRLGINKQIVEITSAIAKHRNPETDPSEKVSDAELIEAINEGVVGLRACLLELQDNLDEYKKVWIMSGRDELLMEIPLEIQDGMTMELTPEEIENMVGSEG